jgi:hypothetical protein
VAVAGAYGVFLLYTAALGDAGQRGKSQSRWTRRRRSARDWLTQAGLAEVRPLEFVLVVSAFGVVGGTIGLVLFAGILPAAVLGAFAATSPLAWYRGQRTRRRAESQDAWPRMIEELRLLTGSLGRARQAGVRFVRRFVLVVPFGMAMAGMTVGNGRAAYRSDLGQMAVVVAIGMVIACWLWAGRLLRLPELERVFAPGADDAAGSTR